MSALIGRLVCVVRPGGRCRLMVVTDDGTGYAVTAATREEAWAQMEQRIGPVMDAIDAGQREAAQ